MNTKCKHCGQIFEAEESYTGQEAECPECGKNFIIEPEVATPSSAGDHVGGEDLILGLYRLKEGPFAGGMGKVCRVHHTGWKVNLAMKQPHAKWFETEAQKETFIHECDAWINLGLHPHIVSCFYVREIDGVPSIFSEWMEGGYLTDWIADGKMDTLEKMLDIAIQFAWGLEYAHEQKLIHQDVKPDNVLLTATGDVKIGDFGIANAKAALGLSTSTTSRLDGTIISAAGVYTPAYAAPEQLAGEQLTRRSDIFSWAMSLVEICIGGRQWQGTSAAVRTDFDFYMGNTVFSIPSSLKELLRECLKDNESERPHDFKIIADKLLEIYREETGKDYPRTIPKSAIDSPDSLNNRALSYIDLGQPEKAEKLWKQALEIDKLHLESTYNRGIYLWCSAQIDDMELLRQMEAVRGDSSSFWRRDYLLALVHLDRNDVESALPLLESANGQSNHNPEVLQAIEAAKRILDSRKGQGICFVEYTDEDVIAGRFELLGSKFNIIGLKDITTGQCICTFSGHSWEEVTSMSYSLDGRYALSKSYDETIRRSTLKLWRIATGQCLRTWHDEPFSVGESFSECTKHTGWELCRIRSAEETLIQEKRFTELLTEAEKHLHDGNIAGALGMIREACCISGFERSLLVWNLKSRIGKYCRIVGLNWAFEEKTFSVQNWIRSVSFSPDGRFILSGSEDGTLKHWDIATGECLRTFNGHEFSVMSVRYSLDGRFALSGGHDHTLKLWNIASGHCLHTFTGHASKVMSVSFSPDGKFALSGSSDSNLKLWDVASGECLRTFEGHTDNVNSVSYSPDGRFAISGEGDITNFFTTLKLWDIASGQCLRTFIGHAEAVHSVNYSPDGRFVLSGSGDISEDMSSKDMKDCTLKHWDIVTGECLCSFNEHEFCVMSVSYSPDGRFALSGSWDHTLKLWNIASGHCLHTFTGHSSKVMSVSFSPDGRFAISGGIDHTIKLWRLDWDYEFPGWVDWDDGAEPYLKIFLTLHKEYTEDDFQSFLINLQNRGYGWLRPEGIRRKLDEMKT